MWLFGHNQWGRSRSPKIRGIALVIVLLGERERAHLVVQPARNFYIRPTSTVRRYTYRNFYFTVTSHELRMRTIFIPACTTYLHVTTLRQRSLDRRTLSEASTTLCQRASRSGMCQGREKRLSRRRAIALQRETLIGFSTTESRSS